MAFSHPGFMRAVLHVTAFMVAIYGLICLAFPLLLAMEGAAHKINPLAWVHWLPVVPLALSYPGARRLHAALGRPLTLGERPALGVATAAAMGAIMTLSESVIVHRVFEPVENLSLAEISLAPPFQRHEIVGTFGLGLGTPAMIAKAFLGLVPVPWRMKLMVRRATVPPSVPDRTLA